MAKQNIQEIPLCEIDCLPQVRAQFDEEKLGELAESIRAVGLQQPVSLRRTGERYVVIDGERRLRAFRINGAKTIPAIVTDGDLSETAVVQRQLICNCQRSDLTALEKARAIDQLMIATNSRAAEVAGMLGMSPASVTRLLALLSLPAQIQSQIAHGEISQSAAYELAQVRSPDEQARLAAELVSGRLTRDGVSGARRAKQAQPAAGAGAQGTSRATAVLGGGRAVTITGAGLTLERVCECLEDLLGKLRKVRAQGLELGTFLKMLRDQAKH